MTPRNINGVARIAHRYGPELELDAVEFRRTSGPSTAVGLPATEVAS